MRVLFLIVLTFLGIQLHAHPEWKEASCTGIIDENNDFNLTIRFDVPPYLINKLPKDASVSELDDLVYDRPRLISSTQAARENFLAETKIWADGQSLPLTVDEFPVADALKAQSLQQGEADRYPVIMSVKIKTHLPDKTQKIEVLFPPKLGLVFTNLRKEMTYQVVMAVAPNEKGEFIISDNPSESTGLFATAKNFLSHGFNHVIPAGWDHGLFMLAMFLGATSLANALTRSLAFTAGHCLTLAAVWLHLLPTPGPWIEPVIALTIGIAGLLAARGKTSNQTVFIGAAAFGLLHGLGFAAAAQIKLENWTGIKALAALAGFNLGVEFAQVIIILLSALFLIGLQRTPLKAYNIRRNLSYAVAIAGFAVMTSRLWEIIFDA
jgi:hydrogenase/urease accessory protein HupE